MATPGAVEEAYRTHGPMVLRRARQILGNEDESREVLHEIFLGLVADPSDLGRAASPIGWFYGATTHRCLNRIRDRKNRVRLLEERGVDATEAAPVAESVVLLRGFLRDLPDEQATAAVHYYLDEMTHDEIGRLMGCSRRHVGNLLEAVRARAEKVS